VQVFVVPATDKTPQEKDVWWAVIEKEPRWQAVHTWQTQLVKTSGRDECFFSVAQRAFLARLLGTLGSKDPRNHSLAALQSQIFSLVSAFAREKRVGFSLFAMPSSDTVPWPLDVHSSNLFPAMFTRGPSPQN
jgi:hypothetical protein